MDQSRKNNINMILSSSLAFALNLLYPAKPKTSQVFPQVILGRDLSVRLIFLRRQKLILMETKLWGSVSSGCFINAELRNHFFLCPRCRKSTPPPNSHTNVCTRKKKSTFLLLLPSSHDISPQLRYHNRLLAIVSPKQENIPLGTSVMSPSVSISLITGFLLYG